MSTQNNDNSAKFTNHLILLFTGSLIAIGILSFINGLINWTGIAVIAVVIAVLLVYRGQANRKTK